MWFDSGASALGTEDDALSEVLWVSVGGSWILYLRLLLGTLSRSVPSPRDTCSDVSLTLCRRELCGILFILITLSGSEIHSKLYV